MLSVPISYRQPSSASQVSTVHSSMSSQVNSLPPPHWPSVHTVSVVHIVESAHMVPSGSGGCRQMP